ncbi:hypothetical protein BJY52DRAFT_834853 [Lactarius psammicola]|nr:hypothetical protein BJY52DRAFT_834853 [Lactarius psammicola]
MSISLLNAQLIALCLSTFLYGLFFALVLITTVVMSFKATDDVRRQRMTILPVSYAMLVVATLHFVVGWTRGVYAFADNKEGSAAAFYADVTNTTSLLRSACLCLQSVMGDGIVIWRLYIVYGKRFKVIVPAIILVTAYAVVGIIVLTKTKRVRTGTDIFHVAKTWITAYFSLTMTTNVLLSGAIALRIIHAGNPVRGSRPHWLIVFTLVESCALYTFSVVAALTTFLSGSFGQYAAVDSIVPIVGIAFCLVVLQIRFHVSASHGLRSDGPASVVWAQSDCRPTSGEGPKNPMRSIRMAIHVSEQTDTDLHSHNAGKDAYRSSLDMDEPIPV